MYVGALLEELREYMRLLGINYFFPLGLIINLKPNTRQLVVTIIRLFLGLSALDLPN